jgi:hypothetical protein
MPLQVEVAEFPRELAVCSPEGTRTPDLFLESDEAERSGLVISSGTNRDRLGAKRASEKRPTEI